MEECQWKTKKKYSYLIYNIVNLGKMAEKPFSWRYVEYELVVKYLENLLLRKYAAILNDVK